jgi:hypothetical protein
MEIEKLAEEVEKLCTAGEEVLLGRRSTWESPSNSEEPDGLTPGELVSSYRERHRRLWEDLFEFLESAEFNKLMDHLNKIGHGLRVTERIIRLEESRRTGVSTEEEEDEELDTGVLTILMNSASSSSTVTVSNPIALSPTEKPEGIDIRQRMAPGLSSGGPGVPSPGLWGSGDSSNRSPEDRKEKDEKKIAQAAAVRLVRAVAAEDRRNGGWSPLAFARRHPRIASLIGIGGIAAALYGAVEGVLSHLD